ncbi:MULTISPECIES: YitT family protein [unclassified Lactococcus]|uniref:YitT family protein n=1 Tax=unclassified Lactococcus TaxID=2643510 RepID=UPI0011CA1510|nr:MULTISPECIES: YitT family protein [unclassified Lactococcus]MQW22470.1 YitT family protein [Lactococcus sp. dk101]TXK45498.1 YitT family protein [Lactococcus sp. dk310]TXK51831.1 YitT family protein [Lactococcus sp. dk322]
MKKVVHNHSPNSKKKSSLLSVKLDKRFFIDLTILLVGVGLYALSVKLFVMPNELASNGIAGLSVFMNFVFGISPFLTVLLINLPLFIFGGKFLEKRELLLSLFGASAMTLWLMIFEAINIPGIQYNHLILAGISDGILSGIGVGLAVLSRGTIGGSLMFSRIMESHTKMPIDKALFVIDIVVMLLSLVTYLALPNFAVTLLSCFIFSKITRLIGRKEYRQQVASNLLFFKN